jgi:dTDP-4-dehydrorhamnose 3,5-epimerase
MKFSSTEIEGVVSIAAEPRRDERGFFERRFCTREIKRAGIHFELAQINHSGSVKAGTVRGLHYQIAPMCEAKIVQCIKGIIFDVAVDLRENSPSYLCWHGEVLDAERGNALLVPHGCAHGFQSLEDNVEVLYFSDQFYTQVYERTVNALDPRIGIVWPLPIAMISDKDRSAPCINDDFVPIRVTDVEMILCMSR